MLMGNTAKERYKEALQEIDKYERMLSVDNLPCNTYRERYNYALSQRDKYESDPSFKLWGMKPTK